MAGQRIDPRAAGTHQVLEDQSQALVSVDDVVQGDDVGMFQVLQQRHCEEEEEPEEEPEEREEEKIYISIF